MRKIEEMKRTVYAPKSTIINLSFKNQKQFNLFKFSTPIVRMIKEDMNKIIQFKRKGGFFIR